MLANFLVELPHEIVETTEEEQTWDLHVDGSASEHGLGVGILLRSPTKEVLEQALRLNFKNTNNEAENEALIADLRLAKAIGVEHIKACYDSQLGTNQFSRDYKIKNERMKKYLDLVQPLTKDFATIEIVKVPRTENMSDDSLAALASSINPHYIWSIPIEAIDELSIDLPKGVCAVREKIDPMDIEEEILKIDEFTDAPLLVDWHDSLKSYIANGEEPEDKWEAHRLKARAAHYIMLRDGLYRWSSTDSLLIYIDGEETK